MGFELGMNNSPIPVVLVRKPNYYRVFDHSHLIHSGFYLQLWGHPILMESSYTACSCRMQFMNLNPYHQLIVVTPNSQLV